ncbi:MAG: type II secretion system protein [Betaproteobacteria bacterium]|jgi:general secretion pathway protein I|nr:type II secretion system protein [Betaproteobacteria bacterium]
MTLQPARPDREAGFTILEVLTAFVLFAVALAVILQVFSGGLRDAQLADEYARAAMMAQSRLSGYTAAERLDEGVSTGRDDPFTWTLSVTLYDDRQEDPQAQAQGEYQLRVRLLRVESKVAWRAADGRDRDVRLATLVLGMRP